MRAPDLLTLLHRRHAEDVFVPECKDGATVDRHHLRLDAWAMKRSWAHPEFIAYEIKVDRQDFLRDEKWQRALPLCTRFFFVTPPSLVRPEEVPAECGLMVATKNGARLRTLKRAPRHEPDEARLVNLLLYVLMSRAWIVRQTTQMLPRDVLRSMPRSLRLAAIREELDLARDTGQVVNKLFWQQMAATTRAAELRASRAEETAANLKTIEAFCREHGIDVTKDSWEVVRSADKVIHGLPVARLMDAERDCRRAADLLAGARQRVTNE